MGKKKIKAVTLTGSSDIELPCGVVWFTVANVDANVSSTYTIDFNDGDSITKTDVAFTTPENMPYRSMDSNVITISHVSGGDVDVVWIP